MDRSIVLVAAVLVAFGGTAVPEQPEAQADLSGVYLCDGKNPDGSAYQGIVQIAAVNDTYLVHWALSNDLEVLGVGILKGDTLSVSYFGGTPVIVVYKKEGERLVGAWTMGGTEGVVFTETLTLMHGDPGQLGKTPGQPGKRPAPARPVGIRV